MTWDAGSAHLLPGCPRGKTLPPSSPCPARLRARMHEPQAHDGDGAWGDWTCCCDYNSAAATHTHMSSPSGSCMHAWNNCAPDMGKGYCSSQSSLRLTPTLISRYVPGGTPAVVMPMQVRPHAPSNLTLCRHEWMWHVLVSYQNHNSQHIVQKCCSTWEHSDQGVRPPGIAWGPA